MPAQANGQPTDKRDPDCLKVLKTEQVLLIDRALIEIGDFGEIHLIVKNGQIKTIRKMRSEGFPWSEELG